jgi:hypothetical protein
MPATIRVVHDGQGMQDNCILASAGLGAPACSCTRVCGFGSSAAACVAWDVPVCTTSCRGQITALFPVAVLRLKVTVLLQF